MHVHVHICYSLTELISIMYTIMCIIKTRTITDSYIVKQFIKASKGRLTRQAE